MTSRKASRRNALAVVRVVLGVAAALLIWSLLLWVSFQIPGSPNWEMARLATEWPTSAEDPMEFLRIMRRSVWFDLTAIPALSGLLFGLIFANWWLRRRKVFLAAAGTFALLLGVFFLAAGGFLRGIAAVGAYALGVVLPAAVASRLRSARVGEPL